VQAFAIDGPPGLAVTAGALGAFGPPPDLVVSGVNSGLNTGHSVIHSGTVGAVLTARTFGRSGVAVSLASSDPWQWDTAVAVATEVVAWMLAHRGSPLVLNVNVPAVPVAEIRGVAWAPLDAFGHFRVATRGGTGARLQFEVATADPRPDRGSDTALCTRRYVTLTPLSWVEANPFPPVPAERVCELASLRASR
jgi:5'-nucleotidase